MPFHTPLLHGTLRWLAATGLATGLATALAIAPIAARAGMGLAVLAGTAGDGPVTVFYPTDAAEQPVTRGVFGFTLAADAPAARGNGRLVVVSHGSGGNPWVHTDLTRELLGDPPGFDRKVLPEGDARIVAFFARHLLPLPAPHR